MVLYDRFWVPPGAEYNDLSVVNDSLGAPSRGIVSLSKPGVLNLWNMGPREMSRNILPWASLCSLIMSLVETIAVFITT